VRRHAPCRGRAPCPVLAPREGSTGVSHSLEHTPLPWSVCAHGRRGHAVALNPAWRKRLRHRPVSAWHCLQCSSRRANEWRDRLSLMWVPAPKRASPPRAAPRAPCWRPLALVNPYDPRRPGRARGSPLGILPEGGHRPHRCERNPGLVRDLLNVTAMSECCARLCHAPSPQRESEDSEDDPSFSCARF
jgi:hypothetical protein